MCDRVIPVRKNKKGKVIRSKQKRGVIKLYKAKKDKNPDMLYKQMIKELMTESGIGKTSIQRIISEYNLNQTISSPPKLTKVRSKFVELIDELDKNAIRQKVHSFWHNREVPTVDKILKALAEDGLPMLKRTNTYRLFKELSFEYVKTKRNSVITESEDLIVLRRKYLRSVKSYRAERRTFYYLDELYCDISDRPQKVFVGSRIELKGIDTFARKLTTGVSNPADKGKRLVFGHIGSREGFVEGGLLCYESKAKNSDYLDEMNGGNFLEWFEKILPLLDDNAVIVMDDAPYHSVKFDNIPATAWRNSNIIKWLKDKNVEVDDSYVKPELLDLVKQHKPAFDKYVIDEVAKAANKIVLRTPPYHSELNAIESAWSQIKAHLQNKTFNAQYAKRLVMEGIETVTAENWRNFEEQAVGQEAKLWELDRIVDDFIDNDDNYARNFIGENSDASSSDTDF